MKTSNKAAKRYFARMKRQLICSAQSRERICKRTMKLISDFAEENPEADERDFVIAFGEPRDYAANVLDDLDENEVLAATHRRKVIHRLVLGCSAILLILIALVCFWKWKQAQDVIRGDFYVVEGSATTMTQEEQQAFLEEIGEQP